MAAWPGGPCPDCGDDMPANLLRCMTCRAWLNSELSRPEPAVPKPFALPEIPSKDARRPTQLRGHYVVCPSCQKELRVSHRFVGNSVACKFCSASFELSFRSEKLRRIGVYANCPHCSNELRVGRKYFGREVLCRHCSGRIQLPVEEPT